MLSTTKMTTVLPVKDMDRARDFYGNRLGLQPVAAPEEGTAMFSSGGGSAIELMVKPNADTSDHTSVSFEVDDLASEMKTLEERGIRFEDYDLPGLKTVDHVATSEHQKCAWFTDTEGNILCLHQNLT
ncbi:VOC family protein [Arthrobacter mobilis]|uniref:VOC family protein n=1 Tax=Arthrobacter mobilis TaxID=2724944 RepID=A0A7X6HAM0_9MICC|nr:VOC family protein [Arthrobacter mobilis]NKX53563.1 VOC family protein [Arthrobacter mobilis]